MTHVLDRVQAVLDGNTNLIHLRSGDADAVRQAFRDYNTFTAKAVYSWRAGAGLHRVDIPHIHTPNTESLDKLLAHIAHSHHPGIYLIEDYGHQLEDPRTAALFANSPFREGRPSGFLSYRAQIWGDVDNARAGMLPFVFEDGMGFERYVDYALDVPMYFVYRDGKYIDVAGRSFRDFLDRKIPEVAHIEPSMSDWADHLTTIFPEVRLKSFLEMRGTDGGLWRRICGMPALWVGILYDDVALDAAWDLVKDWTAEERQAMRDTVPRLGFRTPFRKATVHELAHRMLEISTAGLKRRAALDAGGMSEDGFLAPPRELVNRGYTRAEEMLKNYYGVWNKDLGNLFTEYNFL